jgi:hypothetical protein
MLEPNYYGLWGGKQTAKGTANTAPPVRYVQVGGDFNLTRDDGVERWSDLTKYGNATDWVNSVTGLGEPVLETTPTELAHLLWLFHGAETVTAVTGPPAQSKHQFTPQAGRGHWATFFRRIGQSVTQRQQFVDCMIGRVQIEGSTANKAVRVTPRILSLDPGEVRTADPAAAIPTDKSFLFTDASSSFTIDGVVIRGHSAYTFVADEDLSVVYADDVVAHDIVQGTANATIAVTLYFDADALARWNVLVYGSAAPVQGTKPSKRVPALGSYSFSHKQRDAAGALNGRQFDLTIPGVKWTIPDAPGPNPDGGAVEVTMNGQMRPVSGQPPYTIDVYTASSVVAFTA